MTRTDAWLPGMIISGGQTGADRAALDWAIAHRIAHGGWCPRGRLAADGPIGLEYQLRETDSVGYRQRTRLNVQDGDAALIVNIGELDGGTLQTSRFAQRMAKPHLVVQLDEMGVDEAANQVIGWLRRGKFTAVNIAGPREEKRPGIYAMVSSLLDHCWTASRRPDRICLPCKAG